MKNFFLSRAPTHDNVTYNLRFLYELQHNVVFLKLCVGFYIFDSVFLFDQGLHFRSTKCMDFLTLKRHNSFQNQINRKATHRFAPKSLIFKLQQEVLKFNDTYVSWSSLKTDLVTKF